MEEISASMATKKNISTEDPIGESKSVEETKAEIVLNEESQKKVVKLPERSETNLDPLEYFSRFLDIPEMIFQHFNANDLIKISEVSQTNYNFIATSKALMAKIRMILKANKRGIVQENYDWLTNSSRQYQNVEVYRLVSDNLSNSESISKGNEAINMFLQKTRWKDVVVKNVHFSSKNDAWVFFYFIQSTVECLSLKSVRVTHDETIEEPTFRALPFRKLKQLRLNHNDLTNGYVREFLTKTLALEKFEYRFYGDGSLQTADKELTMLMLKSFDKLQSLTLYERNLIDMFEDESWRQFKSKLTSLAMVYDGEELVSIHNPSYRNFLNFLQMQSDNLEELTFDLMDTINSVNLILKLPKLKILNLKYFCFDYLTRSQCHKLGIRPFEKSTTITKLTLKGYFKARSIKLLLKIMPNVKRLSVVRITQETVQDIIEMKRKFDEIRIHDFLGIERESLKKISDKISSFPFRCRDDICECHKDVVKDIGSDCRCKFTRRNN